MTLVDANCSCTRTTRMRRAVASTVTMTELLVQPYRISDDHRIDGIYALLTTYPNLHWIVPN